MTIPPPSSDNPSPNTGPLPTAPYKGARDFYPEEMRLHLWVQQTMSSIVERFGYEPYNGPMLESFDLYAAKSGSELVNEQLYHFTDRGGRQLAIRPEMTPTLARMVARRANELVFPVRWYAFPNLWRYENPQRGRLREHWQLNVDILGLESMHAEAEVLEVACALMEGFGAPSAAWRIHINNRKFMTELFDSLLGISDTQRGAVFRAVDRRAKVGEAQFIATLQAHGLQQSQIDTLLELPSLGLQEVASRYADRLEGARELVELFALLEQRGIATHCTLDLGIIRGLDYYTGTVFEMFDLHPENNRALFGGGRYDNLTALFQNKRIPGIGFGLGDVTIKNFLESHGILPSLRHSVHAMIAFAEESSACLDAGFALARELRSHGFHCEVSLPPGQKLGKQLKLADRRGIDQVLILGGNELAQGAVTLKRLQSGTQELVPLADVAGKLHR